MEVPQSDKVNKLYLKSQVKQTPPGYKLNRHTPKTHSDQYIFKNQQRQTFTCDQMDIVTKENSRKGTETQTQILGSIDLSWSLITER